MSWIRHDLRCTATPALPPEAHYEVGVLYRRSEGPPPCPECGAPRVVFFATTHQAASVHTFKEFLVDGDVRITSPEGAQRYREMVALRRNVPVENIQFEGRGNVKQRVEELRHRAIEKRRESGFDEQTFRAFRAENNRLTAERNQNGHHRG